MFDFIKHISTTFRLFIVVSLVVFVNACGGGSSSNSNNNSGDDETIVTPQTENCLPDSGRCAARDNNGL